MKKKGGYQSFYRLCQENPEHLKEIFELFFTQEELEMISSRYEIIQALLQGELTQREIAQKYKVSIAQITRGSNALKLCSSKFKKALKADNISGWRAPAVYTQTT